MNIQDIYKKLGGEAFRFILVGGLATGVHYGIYILLSLWINVNLAYTVGYGLSFILNFYLSNFFTFRTKPDWKKGVGFGASHLINYGLHIALLNFFLWLGLTNAIAPLFVFAIVIPVNFVLVRLALKGK